jgi:hypothetical protein
MKPLYRYHYMLSIIYISASFFTGPLLPIPMKKNFGGGLEKNSQRRTMRSVIDRDGQTRPVSIGQEVPE